MLYFKYKSFEEIFNNLKLIGDFGILEIILLILLVLLLLGIIFYLIPIYKIKLNQIAEKKEIDKRKKLLNQIIAQKEIENEIENEIKIMEQKAN